MTCHAFGNLQRQLCFTAPRTSRDNYQVLRVHAAGDRIQLINPGLQRVRLFPVALALFQHIGVLVNHICQMNRPDFVARLADSR